MISVSVCRLEANETVSKRDIPLVISAYLIWKFIKKTKITALADIPLSDALRQAELEDEARYHD